MIDSPQKHSKEKSMKSKNKESLNESSDSEKSQAMDAQYNIAGLVRLLTLADHYIVPRADKRDVRAGVENCPEGSIDNFILKVLPTLNNKKANVSEIELALNDFHTQYNDTEILRIWLQVIKKYFLKIDVTFLNNMHVKLKWQHLLNAVQDELKNLLEKSNGMWNQSVRDYREDPIKFFASIDCGPVQTSFFQFLIELRKQGFADFAEALHQYLHFLRKIALKKDIQDKESEDENLFGIAFNAVPSLLHALKLSGSIYVADFIPTLNLSKKQKPALQEGNKLELFIFKQILFMILKSEVLDSKFEAAHFSTFAPPQNTSKAVVSPPSTQDSLTSQRHLFHAKLENMRALMRAKQELTMGNTSALNDPLLNKQQKQVLTSYQEKISNRSLKKDVEKVQLQIQELNMDDGEKDKKTKLNASQ